ncbi:hypothetical protein EKK97_10235 [Billgrantia tianxiuensis]|jgi:uncharacterized Zn-binding protein involved in type VI secretion|uniref:Zn-binding Pro-Ala-Ala-Arg (PAAR) domain-containing protein, incolved in TypeVI secretion n=1 Tax=Billgrantia tianxiuensis TaxID=2497861 RepID=A0A6I6SKU9_9GAMM|nr:MULTISPECIES: PAAR domain-containing protein [Halomonas]MCE8032049.1 hypothetical protein [Halomonas sp. MCCC 1A11057]QHC49911.1 hypothetical protein EKK97_10235 [Halomonas tianxiuensis]
MAQPIARLGDKVVCPQHGPGEIVQGGQSRIDGRPVARLGDPCSCGGTIVQGSSQASDNGRPIAYLGCKISCGGSIVSGSPTAKVMP